jgi:hypothetical protein
MMLTKTRILAAVLTLTASVAGMSVAQAQTFSDGSTSPGGLVTESGGALSAFTSDRGVYAPLSYGRQDFGGAYAYSPVPRTRSPRHHAK